MTTDNSNIRYVPGNGWRDGPVKMTFRTKMLFINVQLIPNTEIFATQLQMELRVTTRRLYLATQCTCIQFSVIIIIIITDTVKFEVSILF
jgi:hypothetical protein